MKLLYFVCLTFVSFACYGNSKLISGDNEVKAILPSGKEINLHLLIAKPTENACEGWRWGAEDECPRQIIKKLIVFVANEKLFVPRSAFADLGNPERYIVKITSKGFDLYIYGGDAATSYVAKLRFSSNKIKTRKVESGENRESAWEETKFSFPDMESFD